MKFEIVGADAETGADRNIVVRAESETEALAYAKRCGLFPHQATKVQEARSAHVIESAKRNDDVFLASTSDSAEYAYEMVQLAPNVTAAPGQRATQARDA
jgi:hypothetical protein